MPQHEKGKEIVPLHHAIICCAFVTLWAAGCYLLDKLKGNRDA